MSELPDFTTAPAWLDVHGVIWEWLDIATMADHFGPEWASGGSPWEPLGTADEWAKQRDGVAEAAAKLSETMSISPTEALRIVTEATDHIGTRKLTADEWGKRIDRDKLAGVIELATDPSHAGMGTRHVGMDWAREMADAVLAALPELMGGAS